MNKQLVRFRIENGPEWDHFRDYHNEMVEFTIMKEVRMPNGQFCPVLVKPAKITVLIDHIAAPIHTVLKPVRGKIIGDVQGEVLPEISEDLGLLFLGDGADVLIRYWTDKHEGHITFEGAHASREWQITKLRKDGTPNRLESVAKAEDEQGICCEIANFCPNRN